MRDSGDSQGNGIQAISLQLSNEMVRLYKDLFGRGPATAHTHFAGPDCVVATLERSLTPAEQSMVELGSTSAYGTCGCSSSTLARMTSARPSSASPGVGCAPS